MKAFASVKPVCGLGSAGSRSLCSRLPSRIPPNMPKRSLFQLEETRTSLRAKQSEMPQPRQHSSAYQRRFGRSRDLNMENAAFWSQVCSETVRHLLSPRSCRSVNRTPSDSRPLPCDVLGFGNLLRNLKHVAFAQRKCCFTNGEGGHFTSRSGRHWQHLSTSENKKSITRTQHLGATPASLEGVVH